jgi:hypothetical protein
VNGRTTRASPTGGTSAASLSRETAIDAMPTTGATPIGDLTPATGAGLHDIERSKGMADEHSTQEAGRRTREAAHEAGRTMGQSVQDASRMAGQIAGLGTETLAVWTEVSQQVMRDLVGLSSNAVQEATRQVIEMQQANMETLRDMQVGAFRFQTTWPEVFRDPIRWYQGSVQDWIEATHRCWGLARRNAETVTQSFQRMEQSTEEATRTLQRTFKDATSKMQDVYARSERLRAA